MAKRILIQAGHLNVKNNCVASLRRSTGTAGEVEITTAVTNATAELLRKQGVEVKVVDANYNCDPTSLDTDWDLCLCVHGDMDYSGDAGSGFCDYPEPSTDDATKESQRMAKAIQDYFFPKLGITIKSRSNANTRYYYLWASISAKTPCVLIEMGQVKDAHDSVILKDTNKVAKVLSEGILEALGVPVEDECNTKLAEVEKELQEMRESRNKWRTKYEDADKEHTKDLQAKIKHIEELQKTIAELNSQLTVSGGSLESYTKDIEKLKGEIDDYKDEIKVFRESLEESNKENQRLADKLKECQSNLSNEPKPSLIERIKRFFKGGAR